MGGVWVTVTIQGLNVGGPLLQRPPETRRLLLPSLTSSDHDIDNNRPLTPAPHLIPDERRGTWTIVLKSFWNGKRRS